MKMKKSDIVSFWMGLIGAAFLSYVLYRYLQPRSVVTPKPVILGQPKAVIPHEEKVTEIKKDPLTEIRGIGPVTARSLNEAGYFSFKQLASADPEELAEFTGARWDPQEWIKQARELS